jgi:RHS repeat-associated protein
MTGKINKLNGKYTKFEYSSENQLIVMKTFATELSKTPLTEVYYWYDALGRRIKKQVVDHAASSDPQKTFTRQYAYDGEEILVEFDGSNNLLARYTHSGLRTDDVLAVDVTSAGVSQKVATISGTYTFLKDHLGTIQSISDGGGNILQRYSYSAYGTLLGVRNAVGDDVASAPIIGTSYTFTGREFDRESGLYYYRARYYDSSIGRFLQQDPHPGNAGLPITVTNRYAYAGNNPIGIVDPSGMSWLGDFFGGEGGWRTDLITFAVTAAVLVASGVAIGPALLAVGSVAVGAFTASMAMAAFQGGNFWENTGNNFHSFFRVGAAFLTGSALAADVFGGGVAGAGGNGFQGYVVSNSAIAGQSGGLTVGSSALYTTRGASTALAAHEFGHTLQFIGLAGLGGAAGAGPGAVSGAYLGLGALGLTSAGAWWENMATGLGTAF